MGLSYTIGVCASETHFILDEKCAHFNALYYANALYVFLGFSLFIPVAPCIEL